MKPIFVGALLATLGVSSGAFGTHTLRGKVAADLLQIYETGTYYLMIHALALILFGLFRPNKMWPAWCFFIGTLIFTGSLYAITFTGIRMFGAITPIGGVLYIVGWLGFAMQAKLRSEI